MIIKVNMNCQAVGLQLQPHFTECDSNCCSSVLFHSCIQHTTATMYILENPSKYWPLWAIHDLGFVCCRFSEHENMNILYNGKNSSSVSMELWSDQNEFYLVENGWKITCFNLEDKKKHLMVLMSENIKSVQVEMSWMAPLQKLKILLQRVFAWSQIPIIEYYLWWIPGMCWNSHQLSNGCCSLVALAEQTQRPNNPHQSSLLESNGGRWSLWRARCLILHHWHCIRPCSPPKRDTIRIIHSFILTWMIEFILSLMGISDMRCFRQFLKKVSLT